jgi:hypothetical protein
MENNVSQDNLPLYKKMFEDSQSLTNDARTQSLVDLDYYHGNQLTPNEKTALRERGQPEVVLNYVRRAINGVVGVIEKGQADPKAYPRTPDDDASADVVTDVLRYVADINRLDHQRLQVFGDYTIQGTAASIVEVDSEKEVKVNQIRWEEFFYDPRSRRVDFSDARYQGIAKWMYSSEVGAMFPEFKSELDSFVETGLVGSNDSFQDRPQNNAVWVDAVGKRVMVVELYHKTNEGWRRCVFYSGGVLSEGASPYLDVKKRPLCPIVAVSAYIDKDNNRYGLVRDMRCPQDEINKRRSKLLWHVSASQIEVNNPEFLEVNSETARKEASRPDGVLPAGYTRSSTQDMAAGQAQLLQEAKEEIVKQSPNPALLGRESAVSGRSQQIRQEAGLTELALPLANFEDFELRVFKAIWERCKQYWDAPKYIRVTDDEDAPRFVGINQPQMGIVPQVVIDPMTGQQQMVQGQGVVGYENQLAEMDVDIILDGVPDNASLQQELWDGLMKLLVSPQYQSEVPFDVLIELSPLPNKKRLMDKLKKHREEAGQAQQQQQAQMAEMAKAKAEADVRETNSKAQLNEIKSNAEQMQIAGNVLGAMGSLPLSSDSQSMPV